MQYNKQKRNYKLHPAAVEHLILNNFINSPCEPTFCNFFHWFFGSLSMFSPNQFCYVLELDT